VWSQMAAPRSSGESGAQSGRPVGGTKLRAQRVQLRRTRFLVECAYTVGIRIRSVGGRGIPRRAPRSLSGPRRNRVRASAESRPRARRNPALIAAPVKTSADFRSLAALCGLDLRGRAMASGRELGATPAIRTIGAAIALERCQDLLPELAASGARKDLQRLFDVRNGVVHLGERAAYEDAVQLRATVARSCDILLMDCSYDRESFWAGDLPTIDQWLQEGLTLSSRRAADRIDAARNHFAQHYAHLDPRVLVAVRLAMTLDQVDDPVSETTIECPLCESDALASGFPDMEGEPHEDPHIFLDVMFFHCPVCQLLLDDPDLLAAADIDTRLPRPDLGIFEYEGWVEAALAENVESSDFDEGG
jgi:hypothetical protein